jgi:hypothetical protein
VLVRKRRINLIKNICPDNQLVEIFSLEVFVLKFFISFRDRNYVFCSLPIIIINIIVFRPAAFAPESVIIVLVPSVPKDLDKIS